MRNLSIAGRDNRSAVKMNVRCCLVLFLSSIFCATGGCKENGWPLWSAYQARFIDAQGRVFDPKGDQHTTSEGQAYAMFFALANDDRACFDRVFNWTQANLANGDLHSHLPAWMWGKSKDGQWKILDANSASDADIWMAYSLIEAARLWHAQIYDQYGRAMLALIAKTEVASLPGFGPMLMPGPAGFQHDKVWTLNPSYLPLFVFNRLAAVDPANPWKQIAAQIPALIEQSSRHGFAMDWVDYVPGDGFYPANEQQQRPNDPGGSAPGGSYDAIRVYLWAGMLTPGKPRDRILNSISAMSGYLGNHNAPPEKVSPDGIPGVKDGPIGFSAALLPYLRAFPNLSRVSAEQLVRLAKEKDSATGLYGHDLAYYDQNLALFGTGFIDGRFWFGPSGELHVEWKR